MTVFQFDVFLSYNSKDKEAVLEVAKRLNELGLRTWVDHKTGKGEKWVRALEGGMKRSRAMAVFAGPHGVGEWQEMEVGFFSQLPGGKRRRPLIGVLLPKAPDLKDGDIPWPVKLRQAADLRNDLDGSEWNDFVEALKPPPPRSPRVRNQTPGKKKNEYPGARVEYLDRHVSDLYRQRGSQVLDDYFSLLAFFQAGTAIPTLDELLERILKKNQTPTSLACINGYAGTGKSCLLNCLYFRQQEKFQAGTSEFYPVLINLRHFIDEHEVQGESAAKTAAALKGEAADLCARAPQKAALMFIVDSCEDYDRQPLQAVLSETLHVFVQTLTKRRTVKVVGFSRPDRTYPAEYRQQAAYSWVERDDIIQLQRMSSEDTRLPVLLRAYCGLNETGEGGARAFEKLIRQHRIGDIDLFVLSLIDEAVKKQWDDDDNGLAFLYWNYCLSHIRPVGAMAGQSPSSIVKQLAREVFDFYVRRPEKNEAGAAEAGGKESETRGIRLLGIPHLHASVKEFLIAEHIVDLILMDPDDDAHRERYIYPYGINRFVRAIINRNAEIRNRVLNAIENRYSKSIVRDRIHLAYLLGRFEGRNQNLRQRAKTLVVGYLTAHKNEDTGQLSPADLRQRLLLQRTLSISAIYLEDRDVAVKYLGELLTDPQSDNLNRGFHLEYYEDTTPQPAEIMVAPDDDIQSPKKTFEVLYRKLCTDLEDGNHRAMTAIELQTLCSLCVSRHVSGNLAVSKRVRLAELLNRVMAPAYSSGLPRSIISYLDMTKHLMGQDNVSVGSILSELHALKARKRAGWNFEYSPDKEPEKRYRRRCAQSESVSDHIYGCILVAEALLPEHHDSPGYSKAEVIRMLAIHDLSETFTGDIPFHSKTGKHDDEEARLMRRTSSLGTVPGFPGIIGWRDTWEKWLSKDVNGLIAHDIDKIENYLQLMQYLRRTEFKEPPGEGGVLESPLCLIEDSEIWAAGIAGRLESPLGKQIFDSLRHKGKGAGLLEWYKGEVLPEMPDSDHVTATAVPSSSGH